MAYRIDPDLPLDEEVRRIATEQIDRAEAALRQRPGEPDTIAIVRRKMKKLRGLLRLVRPAIGEDWFSLENRRWREGGRALSGCRDASAAIEALDLLERISPGLADRAQMRGCHLPDPRRIRLATALSLRRERLAGRRFAGGGIPEASLALLQAGRQGLSALPLADLDPSTCIAGLWRINRQATAGYRRVQSTPVPAAFHHWRKRVKYHWMHLRLVRDIWPAPLRERAQACKRLSDMLGDANDLCVLEKLLDGDQALAEAAGSPGELAAHLDVIRGAHYRQALNLAASLFSDDPDRLGERIALVWSGRPVADPLSRAPLSGDSHRISPHPRIQRRLHFAGASGRSRPGASTGRHDRPRPPTSTRPGHW